MSAMLLRRLGKEINEVKADRHSGISLVSIDSNGTKKDGTFDDMTHFQGVFTGPPDTPYEGGSYHVDIRIPAKYPFEPPVMKFTTKIWHPNGAICLDTLGKAWSPILTLKTCLISVQSLLVSPEPNDPQDAQVAKMLITDPEQFRQVARQWAVWHAGAPGDETYELSTATSSDEVTEQSAQEFARQLQAKQPHRAAADDGVAQYKGYNRQMIDTFVGMGFGITAVVAAFEAFDLDDMDGEYYELDPELISDMTDFLISEL